jgi:hypothetical protein
MRLSLNSTTSQVQDSGRSPPHQRCRVLHAQDQVHEECVILSDNSRVEQSYGGDGGFIASPVPSSSPLYELVHSITSTAAGHASSTRKEWPTLLLRFCLLFALPLQVRLRCARSPSPRQPLPTEMLVSGLQAHPVSPKAAYLKDASARGRAAAAPLAPSVRRRRGTLFSPSSPFTFPTKSQALTPHFPCAPTLYRHHSRAAQGKNPSSSTSKPPSTTPTRTRTCPSR